MGKAVQTSKTVWPYLAVLAVGLLAFVAPRARADIIYFTQSDGIYKIDPSTGLISNVVQATAANHINGPAALALGPDGNLYVGNINNGVIVKVTPAGAASDYNTGVSLTSGLAFDSVGNLYAAQITTGSVSRVPPGNGTPTILASGLNQPQGGVTDPAGNVYVYTNASPAGTTVKKITPDGQVTTFATGVYGVLWDATGDVYTAGPNSVTITTPAGTVSTLVDSIMRPFAIGLGGTMDLYVYDGGANDALVRVSPAGVVTPIANLPSALAFAVDVPEPGSVFGALLAVLTSFARPRRRC